MYFKEHLPILRHGDLHNLPECLVTKIRMGNSYILTFRSNLNLFLSNFNDLNLASSIVIGDFNAGTSRWWSSDKETFEGRAIHSLTISVGYTQLIDHPTHVINNSSS